MSWKVKYIPEAVKDLQDLDGNPRKIVRKAIQKVSENPLPSSEGGLGKPLGNKGNHNLTGLLKIKLRSVGIRVVYKLVRQDNDMVVIVIGARADDEVYDIASQRAEKHRL
ncbi:MAG: type II toxin-antitoxin system RelE/ParE family toxin [Oscillospiraceae bacterium]|nr:type II toxin-antitoxin system RelE/ParE family toxin [Oscillospiraceae bacterium]